MDPQVKQRYQQRAEEERQKYDNDMANYRQGNLAQAAANNSGDNHGSPAAAYHSTAAVQGQDYSNLLQWDITVISQPAQHSSSHGTQIVN